MDKPVLSDSTRFPTDKVVYSHLGKRKALWDAAFECIAKDYPELRKEWRYYNDGKSWLMKVTRKTKTIFWLAVFEGGFRTTCYFSDKASQDIEASSISEKLKQQFGEGKRYGKIRGISITFGKQKDINDLKTLIDIKLRLK